MEMGIEKNPVKHEQITAIKASIKWSLIGFSFIKYLAIGCISGDYYIKYIIIGSIL